MFEFFGGGSQRQPTIESDRDDAAVVASHLFRNGDENVPLEELLLARPLAQETRQAFFANDFGRQTTSIVVAFVVAVFQRLFEKVLRQQMSDVLFVIYVDVAEIEKAVFHPLLFVFEATTAEGAP